MQKAHIVRGRVLTADGKPLARTEVWLRGANADRECYAPETVRTSPSRYPSDLHVAMREAWTDAQGNFALGDTPVGVFSLEIRVPGRSRSLTKVAQTSRSKQPDRLRPVGECVGCRRRAHHGGIHHALGPEGALERSRAFERIVARVETQLGIEQAEAPALVEDEVHLRARVGGPEVQRRARRGNR